VQKIDFNIFVTLCNASALGHWSQGTLTLEYTEYEAGGSLERSMYSTRDYSLPFYKRADTELKIHGAPALTSLLTS